jgi:hypothetical protein
MKPIIFAILLAVTTAFAAPVTSTEPGDDTLAYFLSKSELVVSGTISTNVGELGGGLGLMMFDFDFRVSDVIKGPTELRGRTIHVVISRRQGMNNPSDDLPLFKPSAERVLFLRESHGYWQQADEWFAIQFPSSWLVKSLKRVAVVQQIKPDGAANGS